MHSPHTSFLVDGFRLLPSVITPEKIDSVIHEISIISHDKGVRSRGGTYAIRNLLEASPHIAAWVSSPPLRCIASEHLGKDAFPVAGTLFDKTATANWLVPWHQALTICVQSRKETPGYRAWSVKAGIQHVQPPIRILEGMLSIRVHLDDCPDSNGALKVLPGRHLLSRLTDAKSKTNKASSCQQRSRQELETFY